MLAAAEAAKPLADGAGSAPVYPAEVWLILSTAKSRAEEGEEARGRWETGLCLYSS